MTYTDLLGIKYTPHGRNKDEGFDCWGLAIEVLRRNGITLTDSYNDAKNGQNNNLSFFELRKPEKNCIINVEFSNSPTHVGVYIGDGLMIHCIESCGVIIEPVKHYSGRVRGYFKVND